MLLLSQSLLPAGRCAIKGAATRSAGKGRRTTTAGTADSGKAGKPAVRQVLHERLFGSVDRHSAIGRRQCRAYGFLRGTHWVSARSRFSVLSPPVTSRHGLEVI
jgi:hypothetical protein